MSKKLELVLTLIAAVCITSGVGYIIYLQIMALRKYIEGGG